MSSPTEQLVEDVAAVLHDLEFHGSALLRAGHLAGLEAKRPPTVEGRLVPWRPHFPPPAARRAWTFARSSAPHSSTRL